MNDVFNKHGVASVQQRSSESIDHGGVRDRTRQPIRESGEEDAARARRRLKAAAEKSKPSCSSLRPVARARGGHADTLLLNRKLGLWANATLGPRAPAQGA